MNIQSPQVQFSGYFKIGKKHDDQLIHDLLNEKKLDYTTQRSPEDQMVVWLDHHEKIAKDMFNKHKPAAIEYHLQTAPFQSPEIAEVYGRNAARTNAANIESAKIQVELIKAQAALMKEKRKTVLGFIKGCFTTNI